MSAVQARSPRIPKELRSRSTQHIASADRKAIEALRGLAADVGARWHEIHQDDPAQAIAWFGLGLAGVASAQVLLSSILLALSFLVFHTAAGASEQRPALEQVLRSREDYGPLSRLLPGVRDLRVYGPTAVNILVHSADLKRFVLSRGGVVRVIVQDDSPQAVAMTALQLDDNLDLERTLHSSLGVLEKLAAEPGFSYRKLPVNPGFSLVIVNADDRNGYLIFESQGFKDENISDRMHIVIKKQDSARWFSYWVSRFNSMWESGRPVLAFGNRTGRR